MNLTLDNAAELLNRYHIKASKDDKIRPYEEGNFPQHMEDVTTMHTYVVPNVTDDADVLQPFQCAFTPRSALTFGEEAYTLEKGKTDLLYDCDVISQWWQTSRSDRYYDDTSDPMKWRFPKYVYNKYILPKLKQNLMQVRWAGVRVEPTPGTAGPLLTSFTGLKKRIQDAITASKLSTIATGPLLANTMVSQVEDFVESIPFPYYMKPGYEVYCSITNVRKYVVDHREKYGAGNGLNNDNFSAEIYDTPYRLIGIRELEGTDTLIFTTPENMLRGRMTGEAELPSIKWQVFDRTLKGMMEFHRFYGIAHWDQFFINDEFDPA